jgi:hypothetical protein
LKSGPPSKKSVATRNDQATKGKSVKSGLRQGERTILVEIPNIPKSRHPPELIKMPKSTGKPKRRNGNAKPPKKYAQKPFRAATSSETQASGGVVAGCKIKRLKSAQKPIARIGLSPSSKGVRSRFLEKARAVYAKAEPLKKTVASRTDQATKEQKSLRQGNDVTSRKRLFLPNPAIMRCLA